MWVINLWPPGMAAVNTVLLWLPGPIVAKLSVVSIVIWAAAGAAVAVTLHRRRSILLAISFVVAWSVTAPAVGWVFNIGFAYSDGIGGALVASALLCGFLGFERLGQAQATKWPALLWFATAGAFTGLSMYFRWALAGAVLGVAVFALSIAAFSLLRLILRRFSGSEHRSPSSKQFRRFSSASVFALAILMVIAPWEAFVYTTLHPGDPTWSRGDYQWGQRWLTDEQLADASFLVAGNANWACEIARDVCSETYNEIALEGNAEDFATLRNAAIQQILTRPGEFLANRIEVFYRGWFSSPSDQVGSFSNVPSGLFFTVVAAAFIWLSVRLAGRIPLFIAGAWISIAGMVAVIAIAHLEVRYLISIQVAMLVATGLLLTVRRAGPSDPELEDRYSEVLSRES